MMQRTGVLIVVRVLIILRFAIRDFAQERPPNSPKNVAFPSLFRFYYFFLQHSFFFMGAGLQFKGGALPHWRFPALRRAEIVSPDADGGTSEMMK